MDNREEILAGPEGLQLVLKPGERPRLRLRGQEDDVIQAVLYGTVRGEIISHEQRVWLHEQEDRIIRCIYDGEGDLGCGADSRGAPAPE